MHTLTLVSFPLCPFVQRAIVALEEKDIPYEVIRIDLKHKPEWFLHLSPLGKVPVLLVDEAPVFESAVILEYLDEVYSPALHPADPLERARHRGWIELSSTMLVNCWHVSAAPTRAHAEPHLDAIRDKLARIEAELGDGPFFGGVSLAMVDAASAPMLQRLTWLSELAPELGLFDDLPKVSRWRDALLARESVQTSTPPGGLSAFQESLEQYDSWLSVS